MKFRINTASKSLRTLKEQRGLTLLPEEVYQLPERQNRATQLAGVLLGPSTTRGIQQAFESVQGRREETEGWTSILRRVEFE